MSFHILSTCVYVIHILALVLQSIPSWMSIAKIMWRLLLSYTSVRETCSNWIWRWHPLNLSNIVADYRTSFSIWWKWSFIWCFHLVNDNFCSNERIDHNVIGSSLLPSCTSFIRFYLWWPLLILLDKILAITRCFTTTVYSLDK